MNRKGQIIGNILGNFPAMIVVFFVMILFFILSGFISDEKNSINIKDDFLNSYLVYDEKVSQVHEVLDLFCENPELRDEIGKVLQSHFVEEYGQSYSFALSYAVSEIYLKVYSYSGDLSKYIGSDGYVTDYEGFNNIFNINSNRVIVSRYCNQVDLYFNNGGYYE